MPSAHDAIGQQNALLQSYRRTITNQAQAVNTQHDLLEEVAALAPCPFCDGGNNVHSNACRLSACLRFVRMMRKDTTLVDVVQDEEQNADSFDDSGESDFDAVPSSLYANRRQQTPGQGG